MMLRRSFHTSYLRGTAGVWSDFSKRSASLGIKSNVIKSTVLNGMPKSGPSSLKRRFNRLKYRSPEYIDESFKVAYDFLEKRAQKTYQQISKLQPKDAELAEVLLKKAEINNPEVLYNFQFNDKVNNDPAIIDYEQPVYRYLGKKHWESYDQMLLMQRLETLRVIPDTMPTLIPRMDVKIKFPYSTGVNKWVEPGELLSSNATNMEPIFKLQEFDSIDQGEQLYTILVVNPDEPDLVNNSYKTTLQYGLCNLKINYNDNIVDAKRIKTSNIIVDYLPPVPEKNVGKQRFAVWVFRQAKVDDKFQPLVVHDTPRDNFNIRKFADIHGLDAVGAHVWRNEWDSNVENVREMYNLPKGRVFSKVRTV